jgi:predicted phage-related endonuclease
MNTRYKSEIPSKEWVQERKNYIGGSEVAAILKEDPHKTPLQVYMRKKGLVPPDESTAIMEFGQIFEPKI